MQVSATHLCTVQWHAMLKVPFTCLEVDRKKLHQDGYAVPEDLKFIADLPLDQVKASTNYGLDYSAVGLTKAMPS